MASQLPTSATEDAHVKRWRRGRREHTNVTANRLGRSDRFSDIADNNEFGLESGKCDPTRCDTHTRLSTSTCRYPSGGTSDNERYELYGCSG
jgi:hypothetical protein